MDYTDPVYHLDSRDLRQLFAVSDESASDVSSNTSLSIPPSPDLHHDLVQSPMALAVGPQFAQMNLYHAVGCRSPQMSTRMVSSSTSPRAWDQIPAESHSIFFDGNMVANAVNVQSIDLGSTPTAGGWQTNSWLPPLSKADLSNPSAQNDTPQQNAVDREPHSLPADFADSGQSTDFQLNGGQGHYTDKDESDRHLDIARWTYRLQHVGSGDQCIPAATDMETASDANIWRSPVVPQYALEQEPQPSGYSTETILVHGATASTQRRGRRAPIVTTTAPVHWQSQTTAATKQAGIARRKPNADAKFKCQFCGESFTRQYNLRGHIRAHMNEKPFACSFPSCGKAFARAHDLKRHTDLHNQDPKFRCTICGRGFRRLDALNRHLKLENEQICTSSEGETNAQCFAHSDSHCEPARVYQASEQHQPHVSPPSEGLELPMLDNSAFA